MALKRCPDEWHGRPGDGPVPWLAWLPTPAQPAPSEPIERLWRAASARGEMVASAADSAQERLTALFRTAMLDVLGRGSPRQREWFTRQFAAGPAQGLRHPAPDTVLAAHAAPAVWQLIGTLLQCGNGADGAAAGAGDEAHLGQAWADGLRAIQARLAPLAPKDGTAVVLLHALARGIPAQRLSLTMPLYRLGQGRRQRRLWRGFSDLTGHIGTVVATHKALTNELLSQAGLPVPRQRAVASVDAALAAAQALGYPVVVKPENTDHGTGVSTGIASPAELRLAYDAASAHGTVLVEKQLTGADHRLVVIDGRLVGALRRDPAAVTGDGQADIGRLLERLNRERQAHPVMSAYPGARLDDPRVVETLARQGLTPQSVPEAGRHVLLRTNANVSTGGTFSILTERLHPDNARMAERAASLLGLDHAGIDYITTDATRPWHELPDSGICEVNPTPAFATPGVEGLWLDRLFPGTAPACIPLVVVVGEGPGPAAAAQAAADWALHQGVAVGWSRGDTLHIGHAVVSRGALPARRQLATLLGDPGVAMAVVQAPADELLTHGLPAPVCALGVFFCPRPQQLALLDSPRTPLPRAAQRLVAPDHGALLQALEGLRPQLA